MKSTDISFESITSIKDERIAQARILSSAAGRMQSGRCLLPGEEIIRWAMQSKLNIETIFLSPKSVNNPFLNDLQQRNIKCLTVSEGILKKITDTNYLIPMVGVAKIPTDEQNELNDFVIVMDGVQDHGNIGSIVRTAHGFGIRHLVTTKTEFDLFYKKIIEASRGTVFETKLKKTSSPAQAIEFLKEKGYQIVTTSPHAAQIQSLTHLREQPLALVIGNETNGASEEFMQAADALIQIPMSSHLESLNVSVAAGISIYELKFKMVMTMLIQNIRSTLGREINVTGKLIQLALDEQLKNLSTIDSTQLILLMVMKCDRQMSREQISKDTACFGNELEAMLNPLLASDLISLSTSENQEFYKLTENGETMLGKLWGVIEASEAQLLHGFSDDEANQFKSFLKRLQQNAVELIN